MRGQTSQLFVSETFSCISENKEKTRKGRTHRKSLHLSLIPIKIESKKTYKTSRKGYLVGSP